MKTELINYLSQFVTENRIKQFDKVLQNRTRYVTVALENIYQPHNASAVLRTCDCFGIQDIHIIENYNAFIVDEAIAMGSSKWLTLYNYNTEEDNTPDAIKSLKNKGYRIIATTPHTHEIELENFDVSKGKFVVFFGTEMHGLSDHIKQNADEYLKIPMFGFTESFNISVSVALVLHHLSHKMRNLSINWQLEEEEIANLKIEWLKKTIKKSDSIIKKFQKENQ
ncbi:MAG: RNA methyltransferase [Bacteroidia bacterium]|nr:RNA methyltransferase [Bacteroidia bacterium]